MATEEENHEKKFAPRVTFGSFTLATDPQGVTSSSLREHQEDQGGISPKTNKRHGRVSSSGLEKDLCTIKKLHDTDVFQDKGARPKVRSRKTTSHSSSSSSSSSEDSSSDSDTESSSSSETDSTSSEDSGSNFKRSKKRPSKSKSKKSKKSKPKHKKHANKKKSRKSGINAKSSQKVRSPQRWAHSALQLDFINTEVAFKNIDFAKLVAGEIEIISDPCTSKTERTGRLNLLKDLAYQRANNADLDTLRSIYATVLRRIEVGRATWKSNFEGIVSQVITSRMSKSRPSHGSDKQGQQSHHKKQKVSKSLENKTLFCRDYQKNRCTHHDTPHTAEIKGQQVWVHHMCATCWLKNQVQLAHPETSPACQHFGGN